MDKVNVGLVIVTYNRCATLKTTLRSIHAQTELPEYVVVVDNCSTDDTYEWLQSQADLLPIRMSANLGFAAGLAEGMKYLYRLDASIDFFWLMDDDSQPVNDALERLMDVKKKSNFKGIISVTGFIDTIWNGPVQFSKVVSKNKYILDDELQLYVTDHALIDGAIIDREVVQNVGYPDSKFFMMCEDVEYCKRIKKAGYHVILWNNGELIKRLHYGGGGGFSKSNLWRGYYGARNHMLILKDYFSFGQLIAYIIRQLKYLVAALAARDRASRIRLRLLGIWHGLKGVSGKTLNPSDFI